MISKSNQRRTRYVINELLDLQCQPCELQKCEKCPVKQTLNILANEIGEETEQDKRNDNDLLTIENYLKLKAEKKSDRQIIKELQTTKSRLYNMKKKAGVETPRKRTFTDDQVREIRKLKDSYYTFKQIADKFGVDDIGVIANIVYGRSYKGVK